MTAREQSMSTIRLLLFVLHQLFRSHAVCQVLCASLSLYSSTPRSSCRLIALENLLGSFCCVRDARMYVLYTVRCRLCALSDNNRISYAITDPNASHIVCILLISLSTEKSNQYFSLEFLCWHQSMLRFLWNALRNIIFETVWFASILNYSQYFPW